ncbi:MAG: hypothetical protein LBE13_05395 [Bacteroidales bacterium]|jgi:hypothetical protein|nr:hypothetical protein [Bacteroidales bacterium]
MKTLRKNIYLVSSCFSTLLFIFGVQCAFYISGVNHSSGNTLIDILFPMITFAGMIIAPLIGSIASVISVVKEEKHILHYILFITLPLNFFLALSLSFPYFFHTLGIL